MIRLAAYLDPAPIARKVLAHYFGIPEEDPAALKRVAGFVPEDDEPGMVLQLSQLEVRE